jgi:regulator of nucleoside diphosphate kinase
MKRAIWITKEDMEQLRRLVEIYGGGSRERDSIEALEAELDRAHVVDSSQIPPDVITMNSEVRLRDLDTGEERVYRLVFPNRALQSRNALSVVAPIGTALLGYRAGDVIEWMVPKGLRRLKVLEVLYQPESAGAAA